MPAPDEFYRDLETLLELDSGTIRGDEVLADLNWDSMAVVSFIAMADEKYNASVHVAQLQQAEKVSELLALVGTA
ncbi:MAG TPA: phosphopantetheine-binding protein [Terrimicrobiaceae bacterium]|nr:phosphopantetheine-binding protein [Terrimicrobiaceae bacterium]